MNLSLILSILENLVEALPTKAVEVGFGDYNDNGTPDVIVKIVLDNGSVIPLGPFDLPFADLGGLVKGAADLLGK